MSDPFPTILQGIPLRIRRIDVNLNRSDFTVNPTSCNPMSVTGTLTSTGGLSAPVSSRFQVGGCQELGFSPRLKIALTGKGKTRSGDHPTLTATLMQGSGQADLHTARVTLPLSLALDPNNSQHVCSYDVAQAVHGGSVAWQAIVGHRVTTTAHDALVRLRHLAPAGGGSAASGAGAIKAVAIIGAGVVAVHAIAAGPAHHPHHPRPRIVAHRGMERGPEAWLTTPKS